MLKSEGINKVLEVQAGIAEYSESYSPWNINLKNAVETRTNRREERKLRVTEAERHVGQQ